MIVMKGWNSVGEEIKMSLSKLYLPLILSRYNTNPQIVSKCQYFIFGMSSEQRFR